MDALHLPQLRVNCCSMNPHGTLYGVLLLLLSFFAVADRAARICP